ncbi:glycosyltransferase [Aerococcus urinaeequi]|uniref:glycosyltransferase n=1 Tax=Aerococcus urinaeequi TaxID=51665 RepID=UPI003D6A53FF
MRVLFAHDNKFIKFNNKFYSQGGFSQHIWERYTKVFENLTVVSRQIQIDDFQSNLNFSSYENVNFVKVPDFHSPSTIKNYRMALKIIDEEVSKADYVIARLPSSIGSVAVDCAKKWNKPYLIEVVGCAWDAYWNHSFNGKIVAPSMFLKMRKDIKHAKYVVYVTNEFLQNRYPTNGKMANISDVELKDLDENILARRIRKVETDEKNKNIVIGTIAPLDVRYKGQEYVIMALGQLKRLGYENYEYHLVGGGDSKFLREIAIKNNVQDKIKFLGSMPHDKIFDWLEKIDIYAQPSKLEGLPRALIEAMSYGVPGFGANKGGIPELLNKNFVFDFDKNTIDSICDMILSMEELNLKEQAIRNFNEASKYSANILENRRQAFFEKFKTSSF